MSRKQRHGSGRGLKVTLWIAGSLIVIIAAGLFVSNYAINKVLNSMGDVDLSIQDYTDSGPQAGQTIEPDAAEDKPISDPNQDVPDVPADDPAQDTESVGTSVAEAPVTAPASGTDKPTSTETAPPLADEGSTYTAEVSTDKAQEVEDSATLKDKATVASVLLKRLSSSDINTLKDLAGGGLTTDEKREARALILERLSEDEYNKLIVIAQKYGVSQGKKYDEVKKE